MIFAGRSRRVCSVFTMPNHRTHSQRATTVVDCHVANACRLPVKAVFSAAGTFGSGQFLVGASSNTSLLPGFAPSFFKTCVPKTNQWPAMPSGSSGIRTLFWFTIPSTTTVLRAGRSVSAAAGTVTSKSAVTSFGVTANRIVVMYLSYQTAVFTGIEYLIDRCFPDKI